MKVPVIGLAVMVLAWVDVARAADPAVEKSEWTGVYKWENLPVISRRQVRTTDLKIVIKKRDKDMFEAEFWTDNGKNGLQMNGTIRDGVVKFAFTKEIKGVWSKDHVGQYQFTGK